VLNLIVNAQQSIAASAGEGTLTLRTYLRGTDAVLEVADDGPGIAPDLARRIFEPFVTTRPVTEASGLGLSTAFGIVVAHGGGLELVESGAGACFRVTLPGAGFAGPVVHSV
jgi:signal transduction histidine kinase